MLMKEFASLFYLPVAEVVVKPLPKNVVTWPLDKFLKFNSFFSPLTQD